MLNSMKQFYLACVANSGCEQSLMKSLYELQGDGIILGSIAVLDTHM